MEIKVDENTIFSNIRKFDVSRIKLVELFFGIYLKNGKFQKMHFNFFF